MRWLRLALVVLASLRCAHAPAAAPPTPEAPTPVAAARDWPEPEPPELRLPDTVRPVRYALDLTLLPAEPTFSGTVTIDVDVREPVRQVWLHAQDLQVDRALVLTGGRTLEAKVSTANQGRLGLLLPEALGPGQAQLTLSFTGRADRERSQGLYAVEEGGEPYLYTFFEPIDARRAFPCFDEPGFKVPWRLRFTVKQQHVALANHPIVSEEPLAGGLKRVTFAESRPMPSYLVAFVVGPFDLVDGGPIGRSRVPLRFIVPRGRGAETAYARSVTPRLVTLLEDFFDQTYPYEKLDVAVVPRFWGTMEHPGIVALGQPLTLIPPGEETLQRRKSYVNIALHELAHYWFGNIVTCQWWDDIWLNEALTTWLDHHVTDRFEPTWDYALDANANSASFALETDSLTTSPPVRKPITTNDDIIGAFDNGTTYAKGASLLTMLSGWLGEERLRDALRAHVRKHAWGVTTSEDFLVTLGESLGPDAARVFRGYIDQPGVPRVSAELQCKASAAPRLKLSQERFLPAGSPGSTKKQTWNIPVCARVGKGKATTRACTLLTAATGELVLPFQGCPTWLLLNAGGSGYYRASYSREQLAGLLSVPSGTLTTAERLAFLADVKAAVDRGDVPLGEAMKLVPATASDPHRLILQRGTQVLGALELDRLPEADREHFRAWMRELYAPRARALGWTPKPNEDDEVKQTRALLLMRAALVGRDPVLSQEGARLARSWLVDRKSVSPEVAWTALQVAARDGDRPLFDTVLTQARRAKGYERSRLFATLGGFRDPVLTQEALALVTGTEFDPRDTTGILYTAFYSPETRPLAWDFYRKNFDTLANKLRSDELGGLIEMAGDLCDETRRAEAEALLTPIAERVEGGPRALARALESIRLCIESDRLHQPGVREFLRTRGKALSEAAPH